MSYHDLYFWQAISLITSRNAKAFFARNRVSHLRIPIFCIKPLGKRQTHTLQQFYNGYLLYCTVTKFHGQKFKHLRYVFLLSVHCDFACQIRVLLWWRFFCTSLVKSSLCAILDVSLKNEIFSLTFKAFMEYGLTLFVWRLSLNTVF